MLGEFLEFMIFMGLTFVLGFGMGVWWTRSPHVPDDGLREGDLRLQRPPSLHLH